MPVDKLLICTDLDRTLISNGPQAESPSAMAHFKSLVKKPEVTLAYVSGRHRQMVEDAIQQFQLPLPDFVIGDVGTSLYKVSQHKTAEAPIWQHLQAWENEIAQDWQGLNNTGLQKLLNLSQDFEELQLQETEKQNNYKLSFYVPMRLMLSKPQEQLTKRILEHLQKASIRANLIWSIDEAENLGLLDILPASASKLHAIEALMKIEGFTTENTVFSGDSGNDIEVLVSHIPAILVANSMIEVQKQAIELSHKNNHAGQLYLAQGEFINMNGNYAAGILEGIAHYHPQTLQWMEFEADKREPDTSSRNTND